MTHFWYALAICIDHLSVRFVAFTGTIFTHITDGKGQGTTEFLSARSKDWAAAQFQRRYNQAPPVKGDTGFPHLVFNKLVSEFDTLRTWFIDGKVSMLLVGQTTAKMRSPQLGNGITFDFRHSLDIDQQVIQFKGALIAMHRLLELKVDKSQTELAPIANMVLSACKARAEAHDWRNVPGEYSGEEIAQRWAAHRAFGFMVAAGADPDWAWVACDCRKAFGPADGQSGGLLGLSS